MKRSVLSALCALALLAGVLALPPAASAQGEDALCVGYGICSITPQDSTPMPGYGDVFNRMSLTDGEGRPVLIESNGDGVIDGNDGLFVTCIAVTDKNDDTMLMFSYDLIGIRAELLKKLRARVLARWGIADKYVLLNASHTHSGVDLGAYFDYATERALEDQPYDGDTFNASYDKYPERQEAIRAVRDYLYDVLLPGMMAAAEDAMADRSEAGMRIGTIQAPGLNFIRHYYNKTDSTDPADVYGSNTRGGGYYKKHFADANPTMYLVEFVREGKQPVVMVDWRAHATSASTSMSNYGKANRYNISPDYVGAFRWALAQAGYLASFFQGTAGNVVPDSAVNNNLTNYVQDPSNPTDKDVVAMWTYGGTTKASAVAPLIGKKLATYAVQGLRENMRSARTGTVLARQLPFYADYDTSENFKMIGGAYPDGTEVPGMLYERVTDSQGGEYNVYDYLQKYYAYVTTPTAEKTQVTAMLDKYNLNSVYHLGRIKSKFSNTMQKVTDGDGQVAVNEQGDPLYEMKANIRSGFDLHAFCIGPDFACVSAPFELFDDPYTFRGERFAMTFVLGYSNGSNGYMPTRETFTFAKGRGAYEANNTAYAPGTAEAIAVRHRELLKSLDRSALPDVCPACGAEDVTWELLPTGHITEAGHYYLPEDTNYGQRNVNASGGTVCLHMNGNSYVNTSPTVTRVFAIQGNTTLNILGEGLIQSQGVPPDNIYTSGGAILVNAGCTLNLYDATVRYVLTDGQWIKQGGAVCVSGMMNMYGGRLEMVKSTPDAAVTTERGGVVYLGSKGVFNMTGGSLSDGEVTGDGDCLNAASGAKIALGGTAVIEGGAYLAPGVELTLTGSPVIRQGRRCALFIPEGAAITDISGLADGAEIWITTDAVPRAFAQGVEERMVKYFRYDGEGRIAYGADGSLSAAAPAVPGDLGGDGKVNGKDVVQLQRYLAGGYGEFTEMALADLNGDGKVNGKDVVLLQRYLAGGYDVTL